MMQNYNILYNRDKFIDLQLIGEKIIVLIQLSNLFLLFFADLLTSFLTISDFFLHNSMHPRLFTTRFLLLHNLFLSNRKNLNILLGVLFAQLHLPLQRVSQLVQPGSGIVLLLIFTQQVLMLNSDIFLKSDLLVIVFTILSDFCRFCIKTTCTECTQQYVVYKSNIKCNCHQKCSENFVGKKNLMVELLSDQRQL